MEFVFFNCRELYKQPERIKKILSEDESVFEKSAKYFGIGNDSTSVVWYNMAGVLAGAPSGAYHYNLATSTIFVVSGGSETYYLNANSRYAYGAAADYEVIIDVSSFRAIYITSLYETNLQAAPSKTALIRV